MPTVQIEHAVRDYATWKAAFDRDPADREGAGVRAYRIYRPTDDPAFIAVDLDFDDAARAEAFRTTLEALWRSPQAAKALGGVPRARIVETVERRTY